MQDLEDVQFKSDVLSRVQLSKIPSETKESESQYSVTTPGDN